MTVYDLRTMHICDITDNTVLALGTFDGCHEGHRAIFGSAVRLAMKTKAKCGIYTFASIPNIATASKKSIYTLEEKINFMRRTGADYVIIEDFSDIRSLKGEEFVKSVLKQRFHCVGAVCGYNYRFGAGAELGAEDLVRLFENEGGRVKICSPIEYRGTPISSTLIREKIENGQCEDILPYCDPYTVYAKVITGKQLGRKMGIPTINQIIPEEKVKPKRGVYVTECEIGEDVYPSVTNVGTRPTTDGDGAMENMETHIIGYDGNLYSSYVKVNFYKMLREEQKFNSLDELIKQISSDCKSSKDYFLK